MRWFWWRISASTEIVAMVISIIVAAYFTWFHDALNIWPLANWGKLVLGSLMTTAGWVLAALLLPPESPKVLQHFVDKVNPGGPGWKRFSSNATPETEPWNVPRSLLQAFLGSVAIYGLLLGTGAALFDHGLETLFFCILSGLSMYGMARLQTRS